MYGHARRPDRRALAGVRCRSREGGGAGDPGAGKRQAARRRSKCRRRSPTPSSKQLALADAERSGAHRRQDGEESRHRARVDWCRSSYEAGHQAEPGHQAIRPSASAGESYCARCQFWPPALARRRAATRWPAAVRSCPTTSRRSASRCSATPRRTRASSRSSRRRCASNSRAAAATRSCRATKASTASCAARFSRSASSPSA